MKKIFLGLCASAICFNAFADCTYNMDMTQEQLDSIFSSTSNASSVMSLYPTRESAKVSLNLSTAHSYLAMSQAKAKMLLALADPAVTSALMMSNNIQNVVSAITSTVNLTTTAAVSSSTSTTDTVSASDYLLKTFQGDMDVSSSGIIAYEYKMKVPLQMDVGTAIMFFPILAGGKLQNGDAFAQTIFLATGQENASSPYSDVLGVGLDSNTENAILLNNKSFPSTITNTADGYQHVGIYINQDSKQVGVIINGKNLGYVMNLQDKLKNISFLALTVVGMYSQLANVGKEVSIEIVTDKSKLYFQYPTGTTDICGSMI